MLFIHQWISTTNKYEMTPMVKTRETYIHIKGDRGIWVQNITSQVPLIVKLKRPWPLSYNEAHQIRYLRYTTGVYIPLGDPKYRGSKFITPYFTFFVTAPTSPSEWEETT